MSETPKTEETNKIQITISNSEKITIEGLKDLSVICKYYEKKEDYRFMKKLQEKYKCIAYPDKGREIPVSLNKYFTSAFTDSDYHISNIYDNYIRRDIKTHKNITSYISKLNIQDLSQEIIKNQHIYNCLFEYSGYFLKNLITKGRTNNSVDTLMDNFTKEELKILFSLALSNHESDKIKISFSYLIDLIIKYLKNERDNINFFSSYDINNLRLDRIIDISNTTIKFNKGSEKFDEFIFKHIIRDVVIIHPIINQWWKLIYEPYRCNFEPKIIRLKYKYHKILVNFIDDLSFVFNILLYHGTDASKLNITNNEGLILSIDEFYKIYTNKMKNDIINFLIDFYETLKSALDYIKEKGKISEGLKILYLDYSKYPYYEIEDTFINSEFE